jgi:hypothetical protein
MNMLLRTFFERLGPSHCKRLYVCLSLAALVGLSCTQVNEPVVEVPKELMPLTVGNRWRYLSGLFNPPDTTVLEITRRIPVTIEGVAYEASAYKYYRQGGAVSDVEWLHWNGDDGLYWLGGISDADTLLLKKLGFKYPAEVGESWPVPTMAYSSSDRRFYVRDTLTFHVVSTKEELETPAGKFECFVYRFSRKPAPDVLAYWNYFEYYSPGLGWVAEIVRDPFENDRVKGMTILYDFQINRSGK